MPKSTGNAAPDVKQEPYPKESPKKERKPSIKSVTWTEEMDRKVIAYVLAMANIQFTFNWVGLQQESFPELTPKQLRSRWDNKIKGQLFPGDILKKAKQAKGGDGSDGRQGSE